jgi:sugar phosphate isomerase/epimerase
LSSTPTRRAVLRGGVGALAVGLAPRLVAGTASTELVIGACRSLDAVEALHAGGAAYVEVPCARTLIPDQDEAAWAPVRDALRASPVPPRAMNSFLPGSLRCTGVAADPAAVEAFARVAFRRAAEVGIVRCTFGSSGARSIPEGYPRADAELQFVALLARLAPHAAEHGVDLCVEPLQHSETNFIHRVSEAQRLVEAVRHPALGITADIFHMLRNDEGPQALRNAGALVRHIHIAEPGTRSMPGTEGHDFGPYLQALADIDYAGLVSLEGRWDDLPVELPRALRTLREQAAEAR